MIDIKLVSLDKLEAWGKNPRQRDPERFEWIKMSLKKFGFVMPVYAREDGMLYSGHQRTGAARELGFSHVPVIYLPGYDEATERGINIVFNLCTNDHATKSDFGKKAAMELSDLEKFQALPDAIDPFPCLKQFDIKPIDYQEDLKPSEISNMTFLFAQTFCDLGVEIPIILNADNKIINGGPRLLAALSYGRIVHSAVKVTENSEAMQLFLNKITMSFDLQRAFGEELRYNSFFRRRNQAAQRTTFGVGFYHWVFGKEARNEGKAWLLKHMVKLEGEYRARFIAEHGTTCIDFGAGRLDNTNKLQAAGITCIPFEPYAMKPNSDQISVVGARLIARRFLAWIATKPPIDSLFCSSVFNSVPFAEDREHLMVIFNFICSCGARLYLHTLSDSNLASRVFNNGLNASARADGAILLDTEPGLYINEILKVPKVQKFHSEEELIAQGKRYFHKVTYYPANGSSHGIKCEGSRKIEPILLVRALEFEFNLPYPGNQRMGLVKEAIDAFSNFTNIDLMKVKEEHAETNRQVQSEEG
ncbi:MAG: ParB N-terminal domain-containing protein [Nostoc sp. SerVER01]|nr:ParB N-terminal domain-containing protein [Nostoc sp. SerVER01]